MRILLSFVVAAKQPTYKATANDTLSLRINDKDSSFVDNTGSLKICAGID